jgi:hypothetical protein
MICKCVHEHTVVNVRNNLSRGLYSWKIVFNGRWFSSGIPAYSTPKTGRHDIAEILLKVALNTIEIKSYHANLYAVQIYFCTNSRLDANLLYTVNLHTYANAVITRICIRE